MASNTATLVDMDGQFEDWIELHNPDPDPLNLSGFYLTDSAASLTKWPLPDLTLPAGGYVVIFASDKDRRDPAGELHANFKMSASGEYLALTAGGGQVVQVFNGPGGIFPEQFGDISFGLTDQGLERYFLTPTPGAANNGTTTTNPLRNVVISEIMYHPAPRAGQLFGDPADEFIEIFNAGLLPVDLTDWQFTAGVDFTFPALTLQPGGYLAIAADLAAFAARYPGVANVVGGWTGQLSNSSEKIELSDAFGEVVNEVTYADSGDWAQRQFITLSDAPASWEWVASHDGGGRSLELRNPAMSNDNGQNWGESAFTGGTPGAGNSIASTNIAPLISKVTHDPAVPRSTDMVTIRARVSDEAGTGMAVYANYRLDGTTDFLPVAMYDDGLGGDRIAGDGEYAAVLPPRSNNTVVEFYVSASDVGGLVRTWPAASVQAISQGGTVVLPRGSVWKYLDNGSDQNIAWRNEGFNDSAWATGAAELGYGDGDETTVVGFGPSATSKYITTYFRTTFNLSNASSITGLTIKLKYDDGAAVYINGIEAARVNLNANAGFTDPANSSQEPGLTDFNVSAALLQAGLLHDGVNTIAVEVHQNAPDSSDISMDLELVAQSPGSSPVGQWTNAHYQVDDQFAPGSQPFYHLIFTAAELARHNNPSQNNQHHATFIAWDGAEFDIRYQAGARNRGNGSRGATPHNIRLNLPSDTPWNGVDAMNLNTRYTYNQVIGNVILSRAGMPAEEARPVQVRLNNSNLANSGSPQFGSYAHVEPLNSDYASNHFPLDSQGNLYKAENADFAYRGTNPASYRTRYTKQSNQEADDFSDLINMLDVLNNAPDSEFVQRIQEVIDVDQWMRFWAINTLLDNSENGLFNGNGDDGTLWNGVNDKRFLMLSHDMDTVLGQGDITGSTTASLFKPTANSRFARILLNPAFLPRYYAQLAELANTIFAPESINSLLDQHLGNWVAPSTVSQMKNWASQRRDYVLSQIPTNFTVGANLAAVDGLPRFGSDTSPLVLSGQLDATRTYGVLVNGLPATIDSRAGTWSATLSQTLLPLGSAWKYLDNGSDQQTAWRAKSFNDSGWASGPAELGYGDGDEATTVGFGASAANKHITTYFRTTFNVPDASAINDLTIRLKYDDGAAVYINGQEVIRTPNLPANAAFDTLATGATPNESSFFEFVIPPSMLQAGLLTNGSNSIAVEIHQDTVDSSDISMDLQILASSMAPGVNDLLVQALDASGQEIDRRRISIWNDVAAGATVSGTISGNTTWAAAGGPYRITGSVLIDAAATLTIEPGTTLFFDSGAGLVVNGLLLAMGTDRNPIQMRHAPGSGARWDGLRLTGADKENVLSHVAILNGDSRANVIEVVSAHLTADHLTFSASTRTLIQLSAASARISDSIFPTVSNTVGAAGAINGNGLQAGDSLVIERNRFETMIGAGSAINLSNMTAGLVDIRDNSFAGGQDEGVTLTGVNAILIGNTFGPFIKGHGGVGASSAILATRSGATISQVRMAGNLFYGGQHGIHLIEGSTLVSENDTFANLSIAAVSFRDAALGGAAGTSASFTNGLFSANAATFVNSVPTGANLQVNQSLIPAGHGGEGTGNFNADPLFVNAAAGDYRLKAGSPALMAGSHGGAVGHAQSVGALITEQPWGVTGRTTAVIRVAGPGLSGYQVSVDGGAFGATTDLSEPITLNGLADGLHHVTIRGVDLAGRLTGTIESSQWEIAAWGSSVKLSEVMVINNSIQTSPGRADDWIELVNQSSQPVDLSGRSITDNPALPFKYVFSPGTIIAPGQRLVLIASNNAGAGNLGFTLEGKGEGVWLYDSAAAGGALLDSVEWGVQIADYSIARDAGGVWRLASPTMGLANRMIATGDVKGVRINEWLASGDFFINDDYIELYNPSPAPVALGGLFLTDDGWALPRQHEISPLSFVGPGAHAVFFPDDKVEDGADHLNFKLSVDLEAIALFDATGSTIDWVVYGPQKLDASQGRSPDGSATIATFTLPNPGAANPLVQTAGNTSVNVLRFDKTWRYLVTGNAPASTWNQEGFNDSGWPAGQGLLADETSTLSEPIRTPFARTDGRLTYYFRTTFDYSGALGSNITLNLSYFIDDGAVFYLNGQEIHRWNMAAGSVDHQTAASAAVGDAALGSALNLSSQWLKVGTNTLAVEVHQSGGTSSDVVMGAALDVVTPIATTPSNIQLLLDNLRITELHFAPQEGPNLEFVELTNTGSQSIELQGMRFRNGIDFEFPQMTLEAGGKVVVVSDAAAFEARYGSAIPVAGVYSGNFDNKGERVELSLPSPLTGAVMDFTYSDLWFPAQTAAGHSIKIVSAAAPTSAWNDPANWTPSAYPGGSPGRNDLSLAANAVVIQEILAHTDLAGGDYIELRNTTGAPIDIGGWFLSDNSADLFKYYIPQGTVLAANGLLGLRQMTSFGMAGNPDAIKPFALSELGEELILTATYADGAPAGYRQHVVFGATEREVPLGRVTDVTGKAHYVPLLGLTLNGPNAAFQPSPVVIDEIHYHPANPADEFIELVNRTAQVQPLFDPLNAANPASVWRIVGGGIDFSFPQGVTLQPGQRLLVVSGLSSALDFRIRNNVPDNVMIFTWQDSQGSLSNSGQRIDLLKPTDPEGPGSAMPGFVPHVLMEGLEYSDASPWPLEADGLGGSLVRLSPNGPGFDPASWGGSSAAAGYPAPGYSNAGDVSSPELLGSSFDIDAVSRFSFQFSEQVTINASHLRLVRASTTLIAVDGFNYDGEARTATWSFNNLRPGSYSATLVATGLTDPVGHTLTGGGPDRITFHITGIAGDMTGDSLLSDDDIDELFHAISIGDYDPFYDINEDLELTKADMDALVIGLLHSNYGDLNLDGSVNATDLNLMEPNFGSTNAGWALGDLNGNRSVTIGDLVIMAEHYDDLPAGLSGSQEPQGAALLANAPVPSAASQGFVRLGHIKAVIDWLDDKEDGASPEMGASMEIIDALAEIAD